VAPAHIVVEQPAGTAVAQGGTRAFGSIVVGSNSTLQFTIRNTGGADLTGLGITIDGTDAAMFSVATSPTPPVSGPSGTTTFTIRFTPAAALSRRSNWRATTRRRARSTST
jgi:uncharacterized membrane protein